MQEKSLKDLEFTKIVNLLSSEAASPLGAACCLSLRPAYDFKTVEQSLEETDDLLQEILKNGELPLSGLDDISEILKFLDLGATASPSDLLKVARQLRLAQRLLERRKASLERAAQASGEAVLAAAAEEEKEEELAEWDDEEGFRTAFQHIAKLEPLPALEERIDSAILNEEELRDTASSELYNIRRTIQRLQAQVQSQLEHILRHASNILQDQLITLRGDRYVIPVKAEYKSQVPGIVHDSSASGATVFIEPMQVVETNNKIRQCKNEEEQEIKRILQELSSFVHRQAKVLAQNQKILAYLDFTQAKAKLALRQEAQKPLLNEEGRIVLHQARHPLIDPDVVVPIDFELGRKFSSLVITGPNTGGKTVSLKTCGLLTLMAMSGLLIPAKAGSEISVWQQVMADIGDEQSIEQSLSTFSAHMKQVIQICEKAGPRTLCILDELGAGTDPSEGAALAIAILDYLKKQGASVVASTHYQELKGYALNTAGVSNASCEFDNESMRPTYKLLLGVPGVSNAINISTRLGLQPEIIEAARALISDEGAQFQSLIEAIERSEQESRRMREEISALKAEAEATQAANLLEKERLKVEREKMLKKVRQEAYRILDEAEKSAEAELKTVRNLGVQLQDAESAKQKLRQQKEALAESMSEESLRAGIDRPLRAEDIEVGSTYEDVISGFVGQASELPDKQDNVLLSKGNISLRVSLENLRPAAEEQNKSQRKQRQTNSVSQTRCNTRAELYLLGYRVNEALSALDRYLDDAKLVGLNSVRIVHGKGSGALRNAVRNQLSRDKRVASFGDAAYGAGDAGVTVVELKQGKAVKP